MKNMPERTKFSIGVTVLFLFSALSSAQTAAAQKPRWKEYVYAENEFAITLPSDPHPHKSLQMPNGTAYTVSLPGGAAFSLHTMQASDYCSQALDAQAAAYAKRKRSSTAPETNGFKAISFREVSGAGYKGIEFVQQVPNGKMDNERWICAPHRLFVFVSSWDPDQKEPQEVDQIVKSFRLLANE